MNMSLCESSFSQKGQEDRGAETQIVFFFFYSSSGHAIQQREEETIVIQLLNLKFNL